MRPLSSILLSVALYATTHAASRPNVLFLAVDDLRNDLGIFGASHVRTPQIDKFAATARPFSHHYVQVPTCGASRLSLLRGKRPTEKTHIQNDGIIQTAPQWAHHSLPALFRKNGYQTLALGKISHHPGGLTGKNWNELPEELPGAWDRQWVPKSPWPHPQAMMHGYANGAARIPGKSPTFESFDGPDDTYPDAWVARDAETTLAELAHSDKPWFFAVGFFKPHLPFNAPKRYFDLYPMGVPDLDPAATAKPTWPSTWHNSNELRTTYSHPDGQDPDTHPEYARKLRTAYAAATSYTDAQIGRVLSALEKHKLGDNTIVVLWSDHGFLLGEHSVWGKHCLFDQALRSPLIIRQPGQTLPGSISSAIVETVDILPTLADLCQLPPPAGLDGTSLRPHLAAPKTPTAKPAIARNSSGDFITVRDDRWRLTLNRTTQSTELYDYQTDPNETRNHAADHPDRVRSLLQILPPP